MATMPSHFFMPGDEAASTAAWWDWTACRQQGEPRRKAGGDPLHQARFYQLASVTTAAPDAEIASASGNIKSRQAELDARQ
jgi:hypothetical protein